MENNIMVTTRVASRINKAQRAGVEKEAQVLNVITENVQEKSTEVTADKLLVMVTGHRPDKLDGGWEAADIMKDSSGQLNWTGNFANQFKGVFIWLNTVINSILAISGMAAGVDMLFGIGAMAAKTPLYAAVPCCSEEQRKEWDFDERKFLPWPRQLIKWHEMLLKYACEKVSQAINLKKRSGAAMDNRNKHMVKMCASQKSMSLAIAVWDGSKGGTGNCVKDLICNSVNTVFVNPLIADKCLPVIQEQILDLVRCGKLTLTIDPGELDIAARTYISGNKVFVRHAWISDTEVFIKHNGISYPTEYCYLPSYIVKGNNPSRYYMAVIPEYQKGDDLGLEFVEY